MTGRTGIGFAAGVLLVLGALAASFLIEDGAPTPEAVRTSVEPRESADITYDEQRRRVRVEVLNGAGDAGAAAQVTEALRAAGFDVKTYGNADRFDYATSHVLDRSGRPGAAGSVAAALGGIGVVERLDGELYLDASVILGNDWRDLLSPPAR